MLGRVIWRAGWLALVLAASGCSGEGQPACDPDAECPRCGPGEVCRGGNLIDWFPKQCLRTCTTADDCKAGQHCLLVFGDFERPGARVCVSETVPAWCQDISKEPVICDLFGEPWCEGDVLRQALHLQWDHVCGYEAVRCPNGCVEKSGMTPARCR